MTLLDRARVLLSGDRTLPGRKWLYQPLPSAKKFHELRTRYKGFSGPVGSGKSYAFCYEALFCAYRNPGLPGLIGAPTFPMLRDATQRTLFEILEIEGIRHRFHKSENRLRLKDTGSDILFRSLDNPERLRGTTLAWFGVDELTYAPAEAWARLEARLRHPKGLKLEAFGAWTPKGFDAVYDRWIAKTSANLACIRARPRENFHVTETGLYDRLAESYDDRFFKQEVLGEYLPLNSGAAYYAFDRRVNCSEDIAYDPSLPLCWSLDFNLNPMASVIAQIHEDFSPSYTDIIKGITEDELRRREIHVLAEMVLPDSNTPKACAEFSRRLEGVVGRKKVNLRIYGDASGAAGQTAGKSDWQIVKEYFALCPNIEATYCLDKANPRVRDRVQTVNSALRSSVGASRLFIHPRCKELVKDLEQVVWKPDAAGNLTGDLDKKTDQKRTHVSDALGYLVWKELPLRKKGDGFKGEYVA